MTAVLTTLFLGTVVGSIYALSAFGLVLTYRASGVFNFAHGAVGMLFAFLFYQLVQGGPVQLVAGTYDQTFTLPTVVALALVVLVVAPLFGWLLDAALYRRLRGSGEVVKVVATIGLLVALQGVAGVVWGSSSALRPTSIFSSGVVTLGSFRATAEQLSSVALSGALALGLVAFLRWSRLGVRMRAVVDAPEMAELSGVDTRRVSAASWAIGTSFSALGGILIVPFFGSLDPLTLTFFVVTATAAAVVGRLRSFGMTLAGAMAIAVAQSFVQRYASLDIARQLRPSIPFIVLFGLLFLPQWKRRPKDRFTAPPLPPVVSVFSRTETWLRVGGALAVAVVAPFVLDGRWQLHLSRVPAVALIFLSLVVVSGYGGQVSLCQAALAGLGAFTAAHLVGAGVPFFAAVVLGGVIVVPIGVFLALRAVSLSPLFLGLATLAFGAVVDEVVFGSRVLSGGLAGIRFETASVLASPRVYYLFALAVFAAGAAAVQNLRRSQTGLALAAMRDSEMALGSLGVDVARLKLTAFSISALLAGLGGAMLSGADGLATPFTYFRFQSLMFLALAVIGGVGSWTGAMAGAILFQLAPPFVHEPFIRSNPLTQFIFGDQLEALLPVFFGLGAIGLARNPNGVVEQIRAFITRERPPPIPPGWPPPAEPVFGDSDGLVTVPHATLVHRRECLLAAGKEVRVVEGPPADGQRCPVCEP